MVRQQKASKVHEDRDPSCHSRGGKKDELVKHDMLDPPRYLRRTEDIRGKALSFGVLDWKQFEKWKDSNSTEGSKGVCCSYASSYAGSAETAASSLELDLATGVVKRLEQDLKPQAASVTFKVRSQECSDGTRVDEQRKLNHQLLSVKQKEQQASLKKNLVEKEESNNASELGSCTFGGQTNPGSETSSKLLPEVSTTSGCQDRRRHDVECSSPVNQISVEKHVASKKGRHVSPNRRFSFSFSQMSRSFSSKESSSSVPSLSSTSQASAKSGPLTFHDSVYVRTKPNGHSRTRSGPLVIPKSEKNVPLQVASKQLSTNTRPPRSRSHALLQFTLRKGINLYQFVVDNNSDNVLAATMKSSDSSRRSYTLYSVKEVKNKSGNWLGRHRNSNEEKNHSFAQTIIGQVKTATSLTSDLATLKSESVLFGVETANEELAAIVQTRNRVRRHSTSTIILPSGFHTLPKDGNAPLPLIDRWKSGGACDCGGWDIGCKLRVLSNDQTKSQSFSSFQLFDQERDEPAFKMVTHDDELHSVEFGSSVSLLEAFFISLAVSSHQNWCEEEEEAELIGDNALMKRETSTKYASNPPVSPIGRV
ncbi:unnamed protein product [Thlaspi arvense]|uniref:Uncharacterized protein n=1 Tax=Thlaspi arvense TaxID=13288 RepID=A0AAU9S9T7_THLAR|nr:unnamed protein product [Thlaspi arvense]